MGNTGSNSNADMNTGSNANTGNTGDQAGGAMGNVMQRVRDTTEQAREMLNEKVGAMGQQLSGVSDSLSQGVDRIRHMDREDYEQAWQSVQDRARQNPGQTILISAAVGFVIGMMMRGGRRY